MIDPEQPNLPATTATAAPPATRSVPISIELWSRLGETPSLQGAYSLTTAERAEIVKHMPQLLAIASRMANPNERTEAEVAALIAPIRSLPSRSASEAEGAAMMAGYRIGLARCPKRLVLLAVERCLQDSTRRFRPSPPELLNYVEPELSAIRRRLHRLEHLRLYPARDVPQEQAELPPEQLEELRLKMEGLANKLGSQSRIGGRERQAQDCEIQGGPPRIPTVQDYIELGLSPEEARLAVGRGAQ